ncbi:MAG: energy transducer TonB [Bacteroidota bacterium]|nr:energy transducer TonB [Bacteroidota bacterium]
MRSQAAREFHSIRLMGCMIAALVLLILLVQLWPPLGPPEPVDIVYDSPAVVTIEDVLPTSQQRRAPPPPAPLPPVVMPDDVLLEEELIFDSEPLALAGPDLDDAPTDLDSQGTSSGLQASTSPKMIRISTPEWPRAAERQKIRAKIVVALVVDRKGRVESPRIIERYLLDEKGATRQQVDKLGYGLEEAALSAALRSMFRPATKAGIAVSSNHQISFRFGV